MLINLSNIGNCLKRVHFFCIGSANYGFDFCNFPFFCKLLVCVKSKETSREFTNFCIRCAFIICIPSMLHFALLSSFYLLIVCSNNLIGSRKSYKYVINKSCSGLRGNILYMFWHLVNYPIYWWLLPQKKLTFQHSKNHLNYLEMCLFLPLFLL